MHSVGFCGLGAVRAGRAKRASVSREKMERMAGGVVGYGVL